MTNPKRAIAGCLILAVGSAILAADAPWPPNHSLVYVAARFPETHPATVAGNKPPDLPVLPACSPLEIYRSVLTDDGGLQRFLKKKEDWRPLIHTTKQACEDYVQAHGLPRVIGYVDSFTAPLGAFRIVPRPTEGAK